MLPLLWPEGLPTRILVRDMALPAPPGPVAAVERRSEPVTSGSVRALVMQQATLAVPRTPPGSIRDVGGPPEPVGEIDFGATSSGNVVGATGMPVFDRHDPVVKAATPTKVKVSAGVTEGLLLSKVPPVYPVIAKTAGISGTVELAARISKEGRIEELRVLSGNAMLTGAAIAAVEQWRYRPFLLNGEPVAVETTVRVVFSLGR
jgi:protein TonB